MINLWTNLFEKAMEDLRINYSNDDRTIINEYDFKCQLRNHLESLATNENDMLIKPEVPWYDKDKPNQTVKFYFDLVVLKKSAFNIHFRDRTLRNKGYYYNDHSLAIMQKFTKPGFNFAELTEDLNKLKIFSDETKEESNKNKPILAVCCSDIRLYDQAAEHIKKSLTNYNVEFLRRLTVFIISPDKLSKFNN
jgi:hypothetical protein